MSFPLPDDECPEGLCLHCWEAGKEVEAGGREGDSELCEEHELQDAIMRAEMAFEGDR